MRHSTITKSYNCIIESTKRMINFGVKITINRAIDSVQNIAIVSKKLQTEVSGRINIICAHRKKEKKKEERRYEQCFFFNLFVDFFKCLF